MNIRKFITGVVMAYGREVSEVFVPLFLAHVISYGGCEVSGASRYWVDLQAELHQLADGVEGSS